MKKSKSCDVSEDRISDLPDSIIQHILSFLDTKDSFKTCVLSKRWESLWTLVPNLIFRCESHDYVNGVCDRFACFVEKVLMKHASLKIQKFLLEYPFYPIPMDQVDSWLQYSINHDAEELHLHYDIPLHGWPKCLYTNYSVKKMSLLRLWGQGRVEGFHWTSLKFLSLTDSNLEIASLRSILEGSPSIECLTLQKCELHGYDGLRVFDSSGTSLKQLVMDETSFRGVRPIDISASNLLLLNIVGVMHQSFNLVDVSSLVEANMDFTMGLLSYSREMKMLKYLIQRLRHVNKLKIGIRCIQDYLNRKALHVKFPPARCKTVVVDIVSTMGYLPGLSALLYSLPDLEQLTINLTPSGYHEFKPRVQPTRRCLIHQLKIVKITGFIPGLCSKSEKLLFELVKYLLDNANVLQKLVIDAGVESSQSTTFRKLYKITQKLLSYPRASTAAVVMFGSHVQ